MNKLRIECIKKFLPKERVSIFCGADWGREIKAVKTALDVNNISAEQLLSIPPPKFKINSINWFITANGKSYIKEQLSLLTRNAKMSDFTSANKSKNYSIDSDASASNVRRKPKSILDFLTYG